jgi:hypothetical protein
MKNSLKALILLLFTLIYTNALCQTEATTKNGDKVILNDDMTWNFADKAKQQSGNAAQETTIPTFDDKSFTWKNGKDEYVLVAFLTNMTSDDITAEKFRSVVMNIMVKSKYQLKNKVSFIPKKLNLLKMDDGTFSSTSTYLGANSYGAESESKSYFGFDSEGNVEFKFTR